MSLTANGAAVTTVTRRKSPRVRQYADDGKSLTLSVWDAARALDVPRDPFYQMIRDGKVRVLRVGNRIRVPRVELSAFLEREAQGGQS